MAENAPLSSLFSIKIHYQPQKSLIKPATYGGCWR
jgi:hypothetical protein